MTTTEDTITQAKRHAEICLNLMESRATKYGEAWRDTRLSSLTDYVLMKYHRLNHMVDDPIANEDKIRSDLHDMINYGLFCLIKLEETVNSSKKDETNTNKSFEEVQK